MTTRWSEIPAHLAHMVNDGVVRPTKARAPEPPAVPRELAPSTGVVPEPPPPGKNAEKRKRREEEFKLSCSVANWRDQMVELKVHLELRWFHAIPNGAYRGKRTAGRSKAEGQQSGVLDWDLPVSRAHWCGLKIELKVPGVRGKARGGMAENQAEYAAFCQAQGYLVVVCYTLAEVIDTIEKYLALPKRPTGV